MTPFLIGLAGPSGCGKSSLVHALHRHFGENQCVVVPIDAYYRDLSHLSTGERNIRNFDHPAAIDGALLASDLRTLKSNRPIRIPTYDFATHTRASGTQLIEPMPVVLVEGIFALAMPGLLDIYDLCIFLALDADACLNRRLDRDTRHRGRDPSEIRDRFNLHVRPSMRTHVDPQRTHAHLVLDAQQPVADSLASCLAHIAQARKAHGEGDGA